jgi:glucose-6-phosphate 1-epimerase
MSNRNELNDPFNIPGMVTVCAGNGGLTKVDMSTGALSPRSKATAEIYVNGATVTHYEVPGRVVLFCSRTSKFELGKAIRGGAPVIFPWFGPHPTDPKLPQHGLVRAAEWTIASTHRYANDEAAVVLALESSDATRAIWPHEFALRYTVTVGKRLELALEVTNTSAAEFRFEEALHTYLAVSDVRNIRITGLESAEYVDKVEGQARKRLDDTPLTFTGETDRVFVDTTAECRLHDPANGDIVVRKDGSLSTVIWNPWDTKAESLADLAGGQWPAFVCIETANAMGNAVTLAPGESHTMKAIIEPEASNGVPDRTTPSPR